MEYFYSAGARSIDDCKNGRFVASKEGYKQFLVDKIGRVVSDKYYRIEPRPDGYFTASEGYLSEMLIDANGRVICPECKDVTWFSDDGIAVVTELDGSKCWLTKGGQKIQTPFSDIGEFSGGFGCVKLDDGKWSYVDRDMNIVDVKFDRTFGFGDGNFAKVLVGDETFVINKNFQVVCGPFESIMWIDEENGVIASHFKDKETGKTMYCYYDLQGNKIGKDYKMIHGFINGLSRVQDEKGYTFIDTAGHEITDMRFGEAGNFGEHFAWVGGLTADKSDHEYTFMRRDGSLHGTWYPVVGDEHDGMISIMKGTRSYLMNTKEKIVSKGFKRLGAFSEGIVTFESSPNKRGYMTSEFVAFVEEHDSASAFNDGFGVVVDGETYDAVNKYQHRLSELSKLAEIIESEPTKVIDMAESLGEDFESLYLLCEHALFVLENALASELYDDVAKAQFAVQKKQIESLFAKTEKQITKPEANKPSGWEW